MNPAVSFLSSLRANGVSVRAENGRLLVEAPSGVITKEKREQLVKRKAELIALLEARHGVSEEQAVVNAQREIASLLAAAYGRYTAVRRVGTERTETSGKEELAKSRPESVHGGVA